MAQGGGRVADRDTSLCFEALKLLEDLPPGREPHMGNNAIRQYWQRGADTQRKVAVRMGRSVITSDRVAVERWTRSARRATA